MATAAIIDPRDNKAEIERELARVQAEKSAVALAPANVAPGRLERLCREEAALEARLAAIEEFESSPASVALDAQKRQAEERRAADGKEYASLLRSCPSLAKAGDDAIGAFARAFSEILERSRRALELRLRWVGGKSERQTEDRVRLIHSQLSDRLIFDWVEQQIARRGLLPGASVAKRAIAERSLEELVDGLVQQAIKSAADEFRGEEKALTGEPGDV